ncbi:hypothetical protein DPMN_121781 [Dreissena polymorpha]|uniref:Uncharacterized protein n=1 Tax=Dreissena polymorpha TaxID=45954 RepID=A0A9D4GU77_DREPO|nr:hypothetical protein DPMN_121781 [Dreissena polymorpha]
MKIQCWNRTLKAFANSLDPDETPQNVASQQDPYYEEDATPNPPPNMSAKSAMGAIHVIQKYREECESQPWERYINIGRSAKVSHGSDSCDPEISGGVLRSAMGAIHVIQKYREECEGVRRSAMGAIHVIQKYREECEEISGGVRRSAMGVIHVIQNIERSAKVSHGSDTCDPEISRGVRRSAMGAIHVIQKYREECEGQPWERYM